MRKIVLFTVVIIGFIFFFRSDYFQELLISFTSSVSKTKLSSHQLPAILELEFSNEVSKEDEQAIREGIRTMDFYLNTWFGRSITTSTLIKVEASGTSSTFTEENGKMVASIRTQDTSWQTIRELRTTYRVDARARFAAHEYVHFYQKDAGCGQINKPSEVKLKWLLEGSAEWLSYKAMQNAGKLPFWFNLEQIVSTQAKQINNKEPLSSYEQGSDVNSALYPTFALAVNKLMKGKSMKALDNYCTNIREGQEARTAFENAFGISLANFYSQFEAYRQKI